VGTAEQCHAMEQEIWVSNGRERTKKDRGREERERGNRVPVVIDGWFYIGSRNMAAAHVQTKNIY